MHKKVCGICGNIFYGKPQELLCYLCKRILMLVDAFELRDCFGKNHREIIEKIWERVQTSKWDEQTIPDWRDYIPDGVKAKWYDLIDETRVVCILFAEKQIYENKI